MSEQGNQPVGTQEVPARRSAGWTPGDVTRWGRAVQVRAVAVFAMLAAIATMAEAVQRAVLAWVFGAGWPTVEQAIGWVGVCPVAVLVAVAVFAGSLVAVSAAGLVERACRAAAG